MITYIDTEKVENAADKMLVAVDDLEREFDALFTRLDRVPTVTHEWYGGQADYYFSMVALDRRQYTEFMSELRNIATELKTSALMAETFIKANSV